MYDLIPGKQPRLISRPNHLASENYDVLLRYDLRSGQEVHPATIDYIVATLMFSHLELTYTLEPTPYSELLQHAGRRFDSLAAAETFIAMVLS